MNALEQSVDWNVENPELERKRAELRKLAQDLSAKGNIFIYTAPTNVPPEDIQVLLYNLNQVYSLAVSVGFDAQLIERINVALGNVSYLCDTNDRVLLGQARPPMYFTIVKEVGHQVIQIATILSVL